jgi:uncharacterized BrkB/YihY/UPF0761 family membrane protein
VSRRAWAGIAATVAVVVLFWAAVSHSVYRETLPVHLLIRVFGEDDGTAAATVVRKLYSIVAFTLLGFVVHLALPRSPRPALRAALIVAAFSALIEVAQKLRHAHEGLLSNAVDVACGALGGWLAVAIARALSRR